MAHDTDNLGHLATEIHALVQGASILFDNVEHPESPASNSLESVFSVLEEKTEELRDALDVLGDRLKAQARGTEPLA